MTPESITSDEGHDNPILREPRARFHRSGSEMRVTIEVTILKNYFFLVLIIFFLLNRTKTFNQQELLLGAVVEAILAPARPSSRLSLWIVGQMFAATRDPAPVL